MEIGLLTVETPLELNFLSALGPDTLQGENVRQEASSDVVHLDPEDAALQNALEIARTQLARRRRGLGDLTQEQEKVIEELLIQTVCRVSKLAGTILESLPAVPLGSSEMSPSRSYQILR
jgi:hypothetical protein